MKRDMEYIDRRPIFTVGMVWFDFAKRLPVSRPRYRHDLKYASMNLQADAQQLAALAALQQAATPAQMAAMAQQQINASLYPFPPYDYYSHIGNIFGGRW
jgi:hypothetical protein